MSDKMKDLEEKGRARFDMTEETVEVIHRPQCIGCKHNGGFFNCDIFGEKPDEYISNLEECPKKEEK